MDWVQLGIFAATIAFLAGVWVTVIRSLRAEVRELKRETQTLREHNEFQDKQIAEAHVTSQVILTKLEYMQLSIEEVKEAVKEGKCVDVS